MGGAEVSEQLKVINPNAKIILSRGNSINVYKHPEGKDSGQRYS
jgi:hypothetical protein